MREIRGAADDGGADLGAGKREHEMLRVLDLFSGIGGFSLGLERTGGFKTIAFCEIDPYCRRVLAKHWPEVPCFEDVRTVGREQVASLGTIDAICGGFPCQDISVAGKGAGIAGERSGLWSEYARLVGEIRPRYVLVENVAALRGRGLDIILGGLAAVGYDAEWHCIPASAVGAPHQRDRIWIVARPSGGGQRQLLQSIGEFRRGLETDVGRDGEARSVAHADLDARHERRPDYSPEGAARRQPDRSGFGAYPLGGASPAGWWAAEPDVGRVAHGVPSRVDRLRGLGNAVVPQIPEAIGRAILEAKQFQ